MTAPPLDPLASFHRDGFTVLRNVFAPSFIDHVAVEQARVVTERRDEPFAVGPDRLQLPLPVQPPFSDAGLVYRLHHLIETILGKHYLVCVFGSIVAAPGAPEQHIHRDHDFIYPLPLGGELPCYALNLIVPLCDLDEETGTTGLYPGTHRLDSAWGIEPVVPYLRRGDCFLVDYRLLHYGTANRGARPRPLYYITFSRRWFFDNSNFYHHPPIVLSQEAQKALPDPVKRLFRRAAIPCGAHPSLKSC